MTVDKGNMSAQFSSQILIKQNFIISNIIIWLKQILLGVS